MSAACECVKIKRLYSCRNCYFIIIRYLHQHRAIFEKKSINSAVERYISSVSKFYSRKIFAYDRSRDRNGTYTQNIAVFFADFNSDIIFCCIYGWVCCNLVFSFSSNIYFIWEINIQKICWKSSLCGNWLKVNENERDCEISFLSCSN